jgi:hypothetical protein
MLPAFRRKIDDRGVVAVRAKPSKAKPAGVTGGLGFSVMVSAGDGSAACSITRSMFRLCLAAML